MFKNMKNIIVLIFVYIFIATLLFACQSTNKSFTQNEEKYYVEQIYDISSNGKLVLSSSYSDIKIQTWDKNEVKIYGEIIYYDSVNKGTDTLLNIFKNIKAKSSKEKLELDLNIISNKGNSSYVISSLLKKIDKYFHKDKESTIDINNVKIAYTIWVPKNINIQVDSKYGKIEMETIAGNVNFTLFQNDLIMENYGKSGIFNVDYSSITIGNGDTATFKIFNCNVNANEIKNTIINAQYSNINIDKTHNISIKSFNSKFNLATVNSLICEKSEYDNFKFDEIITDASFKKAFDTKIELNGTSSSFKNFSGNFEYGNIYIKTHPELKYNLNSKCAYGQVDVPSDKFAKFISDTQNSNTTIHGSNIETECNIELISFSTKCKIE